MLINQERSTSKYLLCCSGIEEQTFQLYRTCAKKVKHPEVDALLVGIAYDSLKHSKTLSELAKNIIKLEFDSHDCTGDMAELLDGLYTCTEELQKIEKLDAATFSEILKKLADVEDVLTECYTEVLQPENLEAIALELQELNYVDSYILKSVFEKIIQDKQNHKETLVNLMYFFAKKETEKTQSTAPMVKYRNPDAWNRASGV